MKAILQNQSGPRTALGMSAMIGRQPIYNHTMGVFAYELLFRSADKTIGDMDPDQATAQVLSHSVINFGLDNLVGRSKAALNVTDAFLSQIPNLPLIPEQIVLDLPAFIKPDQELLKNLKVLSKSGFTLSIEGVQHFEQIKPLLPLADILRIDVHVVPREKLEKLINVFSRYRNLAFQALKVETLEEYTYYRDLGFKYCQGYFLSKPRLYVSKDLPANKLVILNLLAAVNNPNADVDDIASHINQDVSLSYKLLKLINSPFFGLKNKVESIQQALVMLGRTELRSWASLTALSNINDKPIAAIELALIRAKMCELLAEKTRQKPESYFIVGMFSALELLMDQPLSRLLISLPLSDSVKAAILRQEGHMGAALACALAYESNDWEKIRFDSVSKWDLVDCYLAAINWADELVGAL